MIDIGEWVSTPKGKGKVVDVDLSDSSKGNDRLVVEINGQRWCYKPEEFVVTEWEVWIGPFMLQGMDEPQQATLVYVKDKDGKRKTTWKGKTFHEACVNAMKRYDPFFDYYDISSNRYFGCTLYPSQSEAPVW